MKYLAGCARRQGARAAGPHRARLADDRHHGDGALRQRDGLAGGAAALRQGGVAPASFPSSTRSSTTLFPVNGASPRSSRAGSSRQISDHARRECRRAGARADSQSVVDSRSLARSSNALYQNLPANGERAGALRHQPQHQDRPAAAPKLGDHPPGWSRTPRTYRLASSPMRTEQRAQVPSASPRPVRPPSASGRSQADLPARGVLAVASGADIFPDERLAVRPAARQDRRKYGVNLA